MWIKTVPLAQADEGLRRALEMQRALYPAEYGQPTPAAAAAAEAGELAPIVASHTLIPAALYHAFATFGALMSPELPLSRRQHELITTAVSAVNRCIY